MSDAKPPQVFRHALSSMETGPVIRTERLALRELSESDAPFLLQHLNQPSFIVNIRDSGVRTTADTLKYLREGPLASYERHGFGLYLMELKETGVPIGLAGLLQRDALPHPDLGFALDPPFWGCGYATEAATAILEYGFEVLDLPEILAITNPGNTRSSAVLLRIGMTDRGLTEYNGSTSRLFGLHNPALT